VLLACAASLAKKVFGSRKWECESGKVRGVLLFEERLGGLEMEGGMRKWEGERSAALEEHFVC